MIGVLDLLSYQKRELNEEIEILDAVSSQLGNAIIRAELYQKNAKNVRDLKAALEELKETQLQLINSEKNGISRSISRRSSPRNQHACSVH